MLRPTANSTAFLLLASLALAPGLASAAGEEVSPTGKGITGGALLGAEVVMLTEAAAGVKTPVGFAIGGGLGAAAGGVGGYFAEGADTKLSLYLLVGGMALALPTTIAVLSSTAYEPVDYTADQGPARDEPVADPAAPDAPAPAAPSGGATSRAPARAPAAASATTLPALVGVTPSAVTLGVPAVEVRQTYTRTEIAQLGLKQRAAVTVPVLSVTF